MLLVSAVGLDLLTHHLLFIFHPFDLEEKHNRDYEIYLDTYHWLLLFLSGLERKKKENAKTEEAAL